MSPCYKLAEVPIIYEALYETLNLVFLISILYSSLSLKQAFINFFTIKSHYFRKTSYFFFLITIIKHCLLFF